MSVSRRQFLQTATAVSLGFSGLHALFGYASRAVPSGAAIPYGFGPLRPDPNGILDLPKDFTYRVISQVGNEMSDGFRVPEKADGMAAFAGPDGLTLIVRNHEIGPDGPPERGPFGRDNHLFDRLPPEALYDAGYGRTPLLGGTTTLVYHTGRHELVSEHLSLAGTARNCAGGPTPWNAWITCEESTARKDQTCARDHGYTFEVPATTEHGLARPVPIVGMGRFNHEAVAVDPATGIVYQTEDRHDSLIYRFIPDVPERLQEGGRLQALAVVDRPGLDSRNWETRAVEPGVPLPVRWIDLEDIESPDDSLRLQGFENGATRFARGEGMWFGRGAVYFACTSGGRANKGQIWRYTPGPAEGTSDEAQQPGVLELFVEPNDGTLVENCDNLTVSPWGDLVVCEDGSGDQFLVGITPEGRIYKFGRNAVSDSELAGATFSPDGSTLFVNIQQDGLTLAVTGPWH